MELAMKRMFLEMLNLGVRLSLVARRTGVECDSVGLMTVDR